MPSSFRYTNIRNCIGLGLSDGKPRYTLSGARVVTAYPAHIRKPMGLPSIMQHYCRLLEEPNSMLVPLAVIVACLADADITPLRDWYESPSAVVPIPMHVWAVASLHIDHQFPVHRISDIFGIPPKGKGPQHVQACVDHALGAIPPWYLKEAAKVHAESAKAIAHAQAVYAAATHELNTKAVAMMNASHLANELPMPRPRTLSSAITLVRAYGPRRAPLPPLGPRIPQGKPDTLTQLLDDLLDLQDLMPPPPPVTVTDLPGAYPMLAWYTSCGAQP